ncbi:MULTISPECIES: YhcN/YlaJ family sporulation lipoprotein [Bacillaceae]|uniref:YhcN/YlaJ family sporulation lipoprotein n=1 Tax=Bacillaceae TaxID=186817 RepID=UPI001E651347|nr:MULTISPECIES: YhcN/YlaJ family sporulation lipoprotein [Bacillaceae]MCE4048439.1 YhcN/YlaJ family sporulation lipoprotein [Bacillus sp. Au-Bac7]MCM3029112.1 YhcN/YlaJ family sporulation lipoprotein [Niallia sp. MER 6]MDL0435001.1 YhcN/YlaJ family sporulation lipoprotein [Niallia sp. SS-2023]UPO88807.1 YhcN/YlaJ family sporulation lipoprotein [Niallia sp. Man26]
MKKSILCTCLVLLLAGCAANGNRDAQTDNDLADVKNSTIDDVNRKSGQEISERLVNLATSIPNVNDATAVVIGRYAIVGIDINSNLDRSEVGSIKYAVAESLKNDPNGANAMIVADPDINARLAEIAEDIQDGEPVQGIFNELADITGRIIPELPADILNNDPGSNLKTPDNKLNENEKNQLKKDQDEQSNNHLKD